MVLTSKHGIPFKLEGITRIDDTPVHRAMREALANCLTNTDFFVPRGVVIPVFRRYKTKNGAKTQSTGMHHFYLSFS